MASDSFRPSSSNIDEATYDEDTQTLTVSFSSGSTYDYHNVDRAVWQSFKNAPSAGQFFQRTIRGFYNYRRIG